MKSAAYILAAIGTLALGADEVKSYADGYEHVGDEGWVLLCHSADWDSTHDEQWMRRQTSISSACGNALILHVPIYQNPTPEQAEKLEQMLQGSSFDVNSLRSVPCAILLDEAGRPYATISGNDFMEHAAGMIRQAQIQLRTRRNLIRQASQEEGPQRARTLSSLCRLGIAPPPNLQKQMRDADPDDSAGIAEWSPFDPWALAERVRKMSWQEAIAELDRVEQAQLSKEERQAVLAIRIGCVHHHLGAAGVEEIRQLTSACSSLAPLTALGKAAQRASKIWGRQLDLGTGWSAGQLPRIAADCELTGTRNLTQDGEYRIGIVPTKGEDPVRVTRVTLYDDAAKVSEDAHTCTLKAGEPLVNNEYMLIVREAPTHPRLVISFDQQGKTDTQGTFNVRYFTPDGIEVIREDKAKAAADEARKQISERKFENNEQGKTQTNSEALAPPPIPEDAAEPQQDAAPAPAAASEPTAG